MSQSTIGRFEIVLTSRGCLNMPNMPSMPSMQICQYA